MSAPLRERLNKILPRITSDAFLSGSGIGNEIAFYVFDYPPEEELVVRDHLRTLLQHIPKQKHGLRVRHVDLFDFVLTISGVEIFWTSRSGCNVRKATRR